MVFALFRKRANVLFQADGGFLGEERLVGDDQERRFLILDRNEEREGPAGDGGGDRGARREREQIHVHGFGFDSLREDVFEHPGGHAVDAEIMDVEPADGDGGGTREEFEVALRKQRDAGEGEDGGLRGDLIRGGPRLCSA